MPASQHAILDGTLFDVSSAMTHDVMISFDRAIAMLNLFASGAPAAVNRRNANRKTYPDVFCNRQQRQV
jgi:hypothetical protein